MGDTLNSNSKHKVFLRPTGFMELALRTLALKHHLRTKPYSILALVYALRLRCRVILIDLQGSIQSLMSKTFLMLRFASRPTLMQLNDGASQGVCAVLDGDRRVPIEPVRCQPQQIPVSRPGGEGPASGVYYRTIVHDWHIISLPSRPASL